MIPEKIKFSKELLEAKKVAVLAGKEIMKFYKKNHEIRIKEDKSEATEADKASNRIIVTNLKRFNYDLISEEQKNKRITNKKTWIIDPLDGTKDYINHEEGFAVMIGMLKNKKPILGVVYLPKLNKIIFAQKGKGAFIDYKNKIKKIKTSSKKDIRKYNLILSKYHFTELEENFIKIIKSNKFVRMGSIGLKLGMISEGKAELYFNFDGLSIWDISAPQIILEEAGGEVFNSHGHELIYNEIRFKNGIIATNGKCRNEILKKIYKFKKNI